MAVMVDPPNGTGVPGKHYYSLWQTLFEVDAKYEPIKPIGRGSYGIVCSSLNKETKEKVAIKKIKEVFQNRVDALRTLRELKLLRHLEHKNIIALKDVMKLVHRSRFKDLYLVYELMDTDLHQIIKYRVEEVSIELIQLVIPSSKWICSSFIATGDWSKAMFYEAPRPPTKTSCICDLQLLQGLQYLHSANILHRDLKPGNILLNSNCDLKICDFGLARTKNDKCQFMTEYVVTRWYRAPELLLSCEKYNTSIDVWSVGCIFAELLGRKPIFPGTECLNQLKLIVEVLGSITEADLEFIDNPKARRYIKSLPKSSGTSFALLYPHASPVAIELLRKMLVFNPSKRICVAEALRHPYVSSLNKEAAEPTAQVLPQDLDIDENIGEARIRELMWEEMLQYHPEAAVAN
ncbi:Cyclin-dependent kinase 7 [Asimina triloba]